MSSKKNKSSSNSARKTSNPSTSKHRVASPSVKSSCSSSKAALKTSAREDFDWLAALKVQQQPIPSTVKTYKVLSQPIRHELNKYFYDVSDTPSRAERQLLLKELWQIDYTVTMKKLVKYFQLHPLPKACSFSDVESDSDQDSD